MGPNGFCSEFKRHQALKVRKKLMFLGQEKSASKIWFFVFTYKYSEKIKSKNGEDRALLSHRPRNFSHWFCLFSCHRAQISLNVALAVMHICCALVHKYSAVVHDYNANC